MAKTALLSVSDKSGIIELAKALHHQGVKLLSTGGTAKLLIANGIAVTEVAEITGFPEMLDGRVKTLHPKVHAGLLARRDLPEHMAALQTHGIDPIDLLVVNLYPFEQAIAQEDCTLENAIENIDIGGPTMLRSAAKNWQDVTVIVDPLDYDQVLEEMKGAGLSRATKFKLAQKVFAHTAAYDGMITNYLTALESGSELNTHTVPVRHAYPAIINMQMHKVQDMRYGENPHQSAAFYRDAKPAPGTLAQWQQIQGKALSYNNIADADAAWECVKALEQCACVIVKHANPCGVALGETPLDAYQKALATDPTSAFGGIMAFNRPIDDDVIHAINTNKQFVEVLMAPAISQTARQAYASKTNVRLLELPITQLSNSFDFKRVGGGMLLQTADNIDFATACKVVSHVQPTDAQMTDMLFAWTVARFIKSNAIVFCKEGRTIGVGAGQMSRLDSARIACIKAGHAGLNLQGCAVASDAFFPFRDGLDAVVDAGATCVIHPGGSVRDDEIIAAANERGIAMVFTGTRHFKH